jgi:enoyl-CoA hydratase
LLKGLLSLSFFISQNLQMKHKGCDCSLADNKEILVELSDGIATITLNRPEVHNALSSRMMLDLVSACETLSSNNEAKVVVLTGAGSKSFCSGADLGGMNDNNEQSVLEFREHVTKFQNCLLAIRNMTKPIIAAVNGYALAGGCGLAAACDITFASEKAVFGTPEINVGLWPMMISAPLVRAIGYKKAFELMYSGRRISAKEAQDIGLVNQVYPEEGFMDHVYQFASEIAKKSPTALKIGRESLNLIQDMDFEKALTYLRDQVVLLGSTEDTKEGLRAFAEKRPPVWKGR